jgi:ribulose 1,5-bisphosphate synthetase/thiazole synthase
MGLSKLSLAALLLHLLGAAEASPTARSVAHSTLVGREDLLPEYDYVIVGGGTSGLTVADRLTEDGKRTSPVPRMWMKN